MTNKDRLAEILRSAGLATPDTEAGTEDTVTRAGARVLGFRITADGAVDAWRRLLALRDGTGFHPVLSPLSPSAWLDRAPDEEVPFDDRAITAPRELVAEIRDAALADHLKGAGDESEADEWRDEFDPERLAPSVSPVPKASDPWSDFRPSWLCLVETPRGFSVPGLLPDRARGRNWDHGPGGRPMLGSDHVAFLHTWYDRFGAELLYLSGSLVILDVARPPQEPLAVAEAAIEQYVYAPDETDAPQLANRQVRGGTWRFWWD
ncbi:DUF4253 domain-containing protein [Streptomyces venezuelae]|uniref:DUF4253 domain-containing protein n=1 Tax=Streptomyces venezuelae TaxID=54571 RepID=UPI0037D4EB1A